jgi:arylsulfatase
VSDDTIDRSKLSIRRPSLTGVTGKTLADSTPGWELIGHVEPPEGAPNVLVVLIDDAGFGNPSAFGGRSRPRTTTGSPPKAWATTASL